MSQPAPDPEPTTSQPEAQDAGPAVSFLGQTIGDQAIQIAFMQAALQKRDKMIEQLQEELTKKKET